MNCSCSNNNLLIQHKYEELILSSLKNLDLHETKRLYEEYFNLYLFSGNTTSETYMIKNFLISLLALISHNAVEDKEKSCRFIQARYDLSLKIEAAEDSTSLYKLGFKILEDFYNLLSFCCIRCKNNIINEALSYIHKNIEEDLTLENVASTIHISKNYLSSIFTKHTGYSFNDYINKMRINKAKDLLKNTDMTLLDISYSCGFKNQNYFSTIFKKFEGITPNNYRKKKEQFFTFQ